VKEEREWGIASMPLTDASSSTTAHSDAASLAEMITWMQTKISSVIIMNL